MTGKRKTVLGQSTAGIKLLFDPGVIALNQAIELEEQPPARSMSQLVFAIFALVVAGLGWSAYARLDIVTNAHGSVVPAGELVAIQHLEGGVVSSILVFEGQRVEAGQTLLQLAPLDTEGRIDQLLVKRAAHLLAMEVERAILAGRAPNFVPVVNGFQELKTEQLSSYESRLRATSTGKQILSAQISQRRASVERLSAQLPILLQEEKRAAAELVQSRELFERNLTTRDRYNGAQRDAADSEKQRMSTRDELTRAQSELAEFQRRDMDFDAKISADAQESLSKHASELAEVESALENERNRSSRLDIKAPVSGIVTGLSLKANNAVVKPGDTLMELVPTDRPLVVMADVEPQDIAQIGIGQKASIRVSAFDYSMFGTLDGTIDRISASTFSTPEGRQYYKIRVRLAREYFGADPKAAAVMPGMVADVDIKTGTRSVLTYLLKPVTRTLDTAMREP